ncbi:peptidylglycine alpha-hydroxylating monooxygenase isoform X2 [Nematostella vectensis]|uniref:peptidylglycine alpha-hydroxylating monooxygenase isoform X2 n=1 Tax=Nematostella vectensis TaxID=45351 RepID=UPI0020777218|nr:peptidylglycine alpha-hydroxylating monooxygenase isoform X2 [Nematostella vectensis]
MSICTLAMGPACWGSAFLLLSVAVNAKIPFYGDLGGFDAERNKLYDDMVYGNDNIPYKGDNSIEIRMPNVHPVRHDSYFCTALPVASKDTYVVGYDPHAEMHTAHHMLIFGCSTPASNEPHWNCGEMGDVQNGVCAQGSAKKILYAWAGNAPSLDLPEGVAFKVGQDSDVKYLMLQVHYGHVDKFFRQLI